jgi:predicted transcriptional regulator
MPDEISFDELIDELIFIKKVKTGIEQSEKGQTVTTEEAKKKLGKWLK